jgi:hypothetical protein
MFRSFDATHEHIIDVHFSSFDIVINLVIELTVDSIVLCGKDHDDEGALMGRMTM